MPKDKIDLICYRRGRATEANNSSSLYPEFQMENISSACIEAFAEAEAFSDIVRAFCVRFEMLRAKSPREYNDDETNSAVVKAFWADVGICGRAMTAA